MMTRIPNTPEYWRDIVNVRGNADKRATAQGVSPLREYRGY